MRKYQQVFTNGRGFSDWYELKVMEEDSQCCHCGLVHHIQFKIVKGKLFTRCREVIGETKKIRKRDGISVSRRRG